MVISFLTSQGGNREEQSGACSSAQACVGCSQSREMLYGRLTMPLGSVLKVIFSRFGFRFQPHPHHLCYYYAEGLPSLSLSSPPPPSAVWLIKTCYHVAVCVAQTRILVASHRTSPFLLGLPRNRNGSSAGMIGTLWKGSGAGD